MSLSVCLSFKSDRLTSSFWDYDQGRRSRLKTDSLTRLKVTSLLHRLQILLSKSLICRIACSKARASILWTSKNLKEKLFERQQTVPHSFTHLLILQQHLLRSSSCWFMGMSCPEKEDYDPPCVYENVVSKEKPMASTSSTDGSST